MTSEDSKERIDSLSRDEFQYRSQVAEFQEAQVGIGREAIRMSKTALRWSAWAIAIAIVSVAVSVAVVILK